MTVTQSLSLSSLSLSPCHYRDCHSVLVTIITVIVTGLIVTSLSVTTVSVTGVIVTILSVTTVSVTGVIVAIPSVITVSVKNCHCCHYCAGGKLVVGLPGSGQLLLCDAVIDLVVQLLMGRHHWLCHERVIMALRNTLGRTIDR